MSATAATGTLLHVLFRVGDTDYVLPASEVLQMESYAGATAVPGTEAYVAGLVQVRGRVVPVIDLRKRFGLPPVTPTLDTRVVVVQRDERTVGLVVDSAREVVQLAADALKPPPDVIGQHGNGFIKGVGKAGQRLVMLIDFGRVIGQEQAHGGHQ
jgi:purine-binding chemotaxis protein CheW